MNLSQQMIADGMSLLRTQSGQGEIITFNGAEYVVNVNRTPERANPRGGMDVSTGEGSTIEFPLDAGFTPQRGDVGTDQYGYSHAVKTVKHIGHAFKLECEVTRE